MYKCIGIGIAYIHAMPMHKCLLKSGPAIKPDLRPQRRQTAMRRACRWFRTNMQNIPAKCAAGLVRAGKRSGASEPEPLVRARRAKKPASHRCLRVRVAKQTD